MSEKKDDDKKAPAAEKPAPKAETPEEPKPIDETVPGGKYIVDGRFVDAEGNDLGKAR
jgi:hypothetical protein